MACGTSSKKSADANQPSAGTLAASFKLPYSLPTPDARFSLPKELKEVSGLSYYQKNQLLCIQDEEAVAYVFDTEKGKITGNFGFGGYGDFEGIEYVNGAIYALESNGDLFRFTPDPNASGPPLVGRTKTDLPPKTEVEGLGYDPKTKRLLIAVKNGRGSSDKAVYSFDLLNRAVFRDMSLNDDQLREAGIEPGTYKPSAIAVHPLTGEWYILTSAGKRLVISSRRARILYSEALDPELFRQPEGICFAPNGDLYIASEGDGKKGYILRFRYQK